MHSTQCSASLVIGHRKTFYNFYRKIFRFCFVVVDVGVAGGRVNDKISDRHTLAGDSLPGSGL